MERIVSATPVVEEKNYFLSNLINVQQTNRLEPSFGFRSNEVEQAYKNNASNPTSLQGTILMRPSESNQSCTGGSRPVQAESETRRKKILRANMPNNRLSSDYNETRN